MAVLKPLRLVIDNYPEGQTEMLAAENNPEDPGSGSRQIPFSRELFIEREDFMENPPKKFFRLAPGREVRLKHAFYVTCNRVVKDDASGEVTALHCTYDPDTRGGWSEDGRKIKGTLHWVSAAHAVKAEVRLYDHLFTKKNPTDTKAGEDFKSHLNADSLEVLTGCRVEPSLRHAEPGGFYQFLRQGYFCLDSVEAGAGKLVFNRTATLRDTWAKIQKKHKNA
jgi:glutaminyl-tRNA synthetase